MTPAQKRRITEDYARMYVALRRIVDYMPPGRIRRQSQKLYGVDGDEAIEMAYENVIGEAKFALKHVRKPFVPGKVGTNLDLSASDAKVQSVTTPVESVG
jgi:hypothetical protein